MTTELESSDQDEQTVRVHFMEIDCHMDVRILHAILLSSTAESIYLLRGGK